MFKRVQKRARKQEREEELGLDSEMKEVLGLQDTDSEESDSGSSESGSDSEGESGEDALGAEDDDAEEESEDEEGLQGLEDESDEDSDSESEFPPMSVTDAVSDPLYYVSLEQDVRACILCPGKLLKNTRMADVHKSSKAHNRRFTRFAELVSKAGPEGDVRNLIRQLNAESKAEAEPKAKEGGLSKRAEKRKAKLNAIKKKREKSKEIVQRKRKQKEKKVAAAVEASNSSTASPDEPARKKRKVESGDTEQAGEPAKTPENNSRDPNGKPKGAKPTKASTASKVIAEDAPKPSKKVKAKSADEEPPTQPEASAKSEAKSTKPPKERLTASEGIKVPKAKGAPAKAKSAPKSSAAAAKPRKQPAKKKVA
ncbi:hypothetical protein PsYK624_109480 [Phanerochaete sordida]|uniref:Uncharacterized protein n=1 Tax=Phanerochaete sordida TaxID=48140 RepID=A0A9P3GH05_9APHY|nr:hypothetical protein PsYK624_109480 [Phanerochaete sordida]